MPSPVLRADIYYSWLKKPVFCKIDVNEENQSIIDSSKSERKSKIRALTCLVEIYGNAIK